MPTATIIGAHDAKTRLAELLDRVERGEEIATEAEGLFSLAEILALHDEGRRY